MSIQVNKSLKNSYSPDELYETINSIEGLSEKSKTIVYGKMMLFIGMEDKNEEKCVKTNLDYILQGTYGIVVD